MIDLDSEGREYVTWPITGLAGTESLEVSVDGSTWITMEWTDSTHARVLVAGPDATSNPAGTLVVASSTNAVQIRLVDNREIVIGDADVIYAS